MKIRHLLHPLALGISLLSTVYKPADAQPGKFSFTWGEEYEMPKRHDDLGFIGNATDGYIQIGHREGNSLSFQKFDAKLHLTGETETDLDKLPRRYKSNLVTQIGNKYYWFFSSFDKGEDEESLFAQEIDLKAGTVRGSAKEIASSSRLIADQGSTFRFGSWGARIPVTSHTSDDKWNFFYSFDRSKTLVQCRKKPEHRNDKISKDVIGFQVFDDNMNKLWSREIRMPYTEEMMDNEDYSVDSRGNVYLLAKVYSERRSEDRKYPNYRFEILKWSKDQPEVQKIPFRFTDKFVGSAYITEDPGGNVIVGGYYSNRKNSNSTDGIFLLKLDQTTNEMNNVMKGIYPFPLQVMQQYESARAKRRLERREDKGKGEDENLVLCNIIVKADGGIEIFGEESFITVQRNRTGGFGMNGAAGGMTQTTYIYHFNDIMAMSIGSDGEMKWVKKIPKSQQGSGGIGGMSFKPYVYNNDTYFFFMDNMKNLDIAPDETPRTHVDGAGGILMAVKVDDAGQMSKAKVFDVREDRLNLKVANFKQVGNNQLMVRGAHKRRDSQAALITFQ